MFEDKANLNLGQYNLFVYLCILTVYTLVYYRSPEVQVMDYQAQQFKLLPLIASAYALILTGRYMLRVHMESRAEIADGNLESLPEVGGSLTV